MRFGFWHSSFRYSGALLLVLLLLIPATLPAQEDATVVHRLSFPLRHNQYVRVRSSIPAPGAMLELSLPSWTPGSYLIRDYAGDVERFEAFDSAGNPLPVRKTAKNRWSIETQGLPSVDIAYDVWAGELNVSTSWVETDLALINGTGVFMYSQNSRKLPQQLAVELPQDWSDVRTSLAAMQQPRVFLAGDYDELVDSPIIAGRLQTREFEVDGQDYALVLSSENPLWDLEKAADDVAAIIAAQQEFWKVNPFNKPYYFINVFRGPWGGLEHDHSTVMMSSRWQMRDKQDYIKWLSLVAHEFFHSWNVRRMRPESLAEYDYDREVHTRELWIAEGLTSYYDSLLLFRSGLIDVSDYFRLLAQDIRNYETMPGNEIRSAELASFDTWIKHYKPDENSINSTVSYYRKGALIGFVADTEIRRATNNRSSLDDVMREMYSRYGPSSANRNGYPPGAFEALVEEEAGADVRQRVKRLIRTTADPEVDEALAWYGLSLDRDVERSKAELNGGTPPLGFGVSWEHDGPLLLIDQVIRGNSGAEAGLLPGDEVVAIDGFRVTPDNYAARLQLFEPGASVQVTLTRHDRLMQLPVEVQHEVPESYSVVADENLSRREKQRMESWLGRGLLFLD